MAILSINSASRGATYTWTSTTVGTLDWTTAGNWDLSTQYVSDPSNELMFFSDSTTNFVGTGARNITTNVPAALSMNTLTLNGRGLSSGASAIAITIGTSASTWTIGDGTTSTVNLNANFGATAAADFQPTVAANLILNQATTVFTGSGTAGLNNTAAATSTGSGFLFSGSIGQFASGYGITKEGTSRLTFSNNNLTFTGPLTVNGGYLILTGNSNLPSNSMTVNTGAILRIGNNTATQIGAAGVYSGNISTGTGGTLQLWSTSAQEFSGVISGSGGIHKAYGGTLTLSGANTYTGKSQFLPQTTAGFTVNVSSFNSVNGGTPLLLSSSLGAPTTIANGTIDLGSGAAQAGVNLTYISTATGETTDRVINLGFNGSSSQTITANNSTGVLRFTSAFTSNAGTSGQLILRGTGAGQIDQGLPQLANGGLNKNDAGTWTLGGSGNFTGATIITAGTLSLSSATALQFSPFNTASVAGSASAGLKIATTTLSLGGLTGSNSFESRFNSTSSVLYSGLTALTFTNAAGSTSTYSGGLGEGATGMTLTKNGAGTQYLSGTMGYTGATTVNAGVLGSNSSFSGAVSVANGAGLAPGASAGAFGTFTISNNTSSALTLNSSNLLMDISTASNDLIAVTGTTVLNGTNTVLANMTTGVADGTYTLMTYGATTGSGSVVFANGTTTLGNATLAVNAGNVQMTVAGGGLNNSVWVGTTGTWDSGTNWNRNGVAAQAFTAGDFVTIDDTATTTTITSAGTVSPTSLTVNNTTKAFTISATIGGTGTPLVKLGTNTLTLSGTNSYTGGTFIGGGRLAITANANLGDAAGSITFNGGELYITNDFSSARTVTLNAVAGNQILMQGNGDWTNTGAFTGDGGIYIKANPNGGTSVTMNSLSNDFKGSLTIDANGQGQTVTTRSLADSATANGNILFAASTAAQNFVWSASAGGALSLNNRSFGFTGNGNAIGKISNLHTTNAITINTDLVNTGTGTKTLTLEAVAGPTNVFDGDIGNGSGTVAVTKAGAGTWSLSGNNSYTGGTTLTLGTLNINSATALGATASTFTITAGTIGNTSGGAITLSNNNAMAWNGNFSAIVSNDLNLGTGAVTMSATRNLTVGGNVTVGGAISGIGFGIIKGGGGTLALTGNSSYSGTTVVNEGTLSFNTIGNVSGGNSALGAPTSAVNGTIALGSAALGATLRYTGTGSTTDRVINLSGTTGAVGIDQSGASGLLLFNSAFTATGAGSKTLSLTGSTAGTGEIAGAIVDNSGTNKTSLAKSGTGTWILSGANTYTGTTSITGGKLRIANSSGSATGTGAVNLSGGSTTTLSGTGRSTGLLTVTSDSRIAAGINSTGANGNFGAAGTLSLGTTGGMTLTSANLDFDLSTTAGGVNDLILTGGVLSLTGNETFTFNLLGATLDTTTAYTLISGAASSNFVTGNTSTWTTNFVNSSLYTATYTVNPTNLQVTFAAIPEPKAALLGCIGLLLILRRRR